MKFEGEDGAAFLEFERQWRWVLVEVLEWPESDFLRFVERQKREFSEDDSPERFFFWGSYLRRLRSEVLPEHVRNAYPSGQGIHATSLVFSAILGVSRKPYARETLTLSESRRRYWKLIRRLERAPLLCGRRRVSVDKGS